MFNLQIVNASLEDDAIFECQVGPSLNNRPIRASARVNVMRKSIHPKKGYQNYFMNISRFFWEDTMFENYSKCLTFSILAFSTNFVLLKLACLVALFGRKL